ncbi:hypothetical protein C0T31_01005 [Dysgonamonadaceae bacterium]|nr:hypothetical protein C0T31_01005 [Dysgonamonadaceae bacterium]
MFNMSKIINQKTAKVRTKFDEKNDPGTNNESGKSEAGIQKQKRGYCLSGKGSLIAEGSDTSFFGRILD